VEHIAYDAVDDSLKTDVAHRDSPEVELELEHWLFRRCKLERCQDWLTALDPRLDPCGKLDLKLGRRHRDLQSHGSLDIDGELHGLVRNPPKAACKLDVLVRAGWEEVHLDHPR